MRNKLFYLRQELKLFEPMPREGGTVWGGGGGEIRKFEHINIKYKHNYLKNIDPLFKYIIHFIPYPIYIIIKQYFIPIQ
jgi:hypothetical protein